MSINAHRFRISVALLVHSKLIRQLLVENAIAQKRILGIDCRILGIKRTKKKNINKNTKIEH